MTTAKEIVVAARLALSKPTIANQYDKAADVMARHILASAAAEEAAAKKAAEPVTVAKLESWGGEHVPDSLRSDATERRFHGTGSTGYRCVYRGGAWCVDHYVPRICGWQFLVTDRNTVGQMRQTLEGLGIVLKGEK